MLKRSPNLEKLVISGNNSEPVDMSILAENRWPHLRSLVIGDALAQQPVVGVPADDGSTPFVEFLVAHPELETLHLGSRSGVPGWQLSLLDRQHDSLPHLREFSGTLDQVSHLPASIQHHILTLRLREPVYLREVTPLQISSVLKMLPALQRLSLAVVLHSSYDHGGVLRAVVGGAPKLVELEFTCAAKPCFLLVSSLAFRDRALVRSPYFIIADRSSNGRRRSLGPFGH
jgi:hypothetical protein